MPPQGNERGNEDQFSSCRPVDTATQTAPSAAERRTGGGHTHLGVGVREVHPEVEVVADGSRASARLSRGRERGVDAPLLEELLA